MERALKSNTNKENEDQNQRVESSHIHHPQPEPGSDTEGLDDEYWPLSDRPNFSRVLTKTNVKPAYHMHFPSNMRNCFPDGTAPLVIKYCGKKWQATYCGEGRPKKVIRGGWKAFVDDNNLKAGDALVFEVLTSCPMIVKVRVQILRGDLPAELQKKIDGSSYESAIPVD